MWTGCGDSQTGPSQVSASISRGESGRSRSNRGIHTRTNTHRPLCKVVWEIKYIYYPGYCGFLVRSRVMLSPLWTWRWYMWLCVTTRNIVFIPTPSPLNSLADFHAWHLTVESLCLTQVAMCQITRDLYVKGMCFVLGSEGQTIFWGVPVDSQHYKKVTQMTWIREVVDVIGGSEGHTLVYSKWQHFYKLWFDRNQGQRAVFPICSS